MSDITVKVVENPSRMFLKNLWELSGHGVFFDPCWKDFLHRRSQTPICITVDQNNCTTAFCIAVLENGPIGGAFWLPTYPVFCTRDQRAEKTLWAELIDYAKKHLIFEFDILSFDSKQIKIPQLFKSAKFIEREEFIWDLASMDSDPGRLSKNNRRNIKKGDKAGLTLICSDECSLVKTHIQMCLHSEQRRLNKANYQNKLNGDTYRYTRIMESGHGEIFQAILNDAVISSVLLLGRGGRRYYHSAGTSPDGLRVGASHWLVWNIALSLEKMGVRWFNLAGVGEGQDGLRRFKNGYPTEVIKLYHYYYRPFGDHIFAKVLKKLVRAYSRIKSNAK